MAVEPEPASEPQPAPVVAVEPASEPAVAVEPEPALESEPAPVVAVEPESEPAPVVAVEPEPALDLALEPEPEFTETVEPEPAESISSPVSATPLLFLAVSEMMASFTQIPTTSAWKPLAPALLTVGPVVTPPISGSGLGGWVASPGSAPSVIDGVGWLAAIEQRIPRVGFAWLVSPAEPAEVEPVAESFEAVEQAALGVEEGGQYGPVAPNERLWTIAAKVRPDPSINTSIMMQALFMANPQAFTREDMNYLKVDAVLRIPTLREIAEYTGSRAARQLLDLEQQNQALPAPANGEGEM